MEPLRRACSSCSRGLACCVSRSLSCSSPCADFKLNQARMTRKVADAEIRGRLPPMDISPGDLLSGSASPKLSMTLSEYHQVRDLNLLARNREARLHHWPCRVWSFPNDRPQQARGETVSPEEPCSMPEWSDRVHLALYRMMILAAGLAGAYHEPTLKATDPEAGMSLIFAWMSAVVYPRSDVTCSVYSDDRSLGSRFISKHGRYRTFPEPCSRAEWHGNAFKVMG